MKGMAKMICKGFRFGFMLLAVWIIFSAFVISFVPDAAAQGPRTIRQNGLSVKVITKVDEVKIRRAPSPDAEVMTTMRIFYPLFVFNTAEENDSTALKINGFYRVGRSSDAQEILGWVDEKDVVEWNHRECAIFTEQIGRPYARVYNTVEDLQSGIQMKFKDDLAISEEPPGLDSIQNRIRMPLPILESSDFNIKDSLYVAYNLAYLQSGGVDTVLCDRECIAKRNGTADVVFVIDATLSMAPYINAVREVVTELAQWLSTADTTVTFRVSLVAFRDYFPPGKPIDEYVVKRFIPLTRNLSDFINSLHNVRAATRDNAQCTEALFDGVFEAVQNTRWSPLGFRVVIIIGDNSGREPDDPLNPNHFSQDLLLDLAQPNKIRFLCLKIQGECNESNDQQRHREQMQRFAQGRGPETKGQYVEVQFGAAYMSQYKDILTGFLQQEINRARQVIELAGGGKTIVRPANMTDDDWTILWSNLNTRLLDKSSNKPHYFSTGYVLQNRYGSQYKFFDPCAMFTNEELELYIMMLGYFARVENKSAREIIWPLVQEQFKRVTGEELEWQETQTIDSFLEQKFGIPISDVGLLGISKKALNEIDSDPQRLNRMINYVKTTKQNLQRFLDDPSKWMSVSERESIGYVPLKSFP